MKKFFCIVIFFTSVILFSQVPAYEKYSLKITAIDLSEDMNKISSKNDELLLLIYEFSDSIEILGKPIVAEKFILDTGKRNYDVPNIEFSKPSYIIFLIELDDERSIEQIDPVVRVYHKEIVSVFNSRNFLGLEKYLGDNECLGYHKYLVSDAKNRMYSFEIKGRQTLDSYHYKIAIQ